MGQKSEGGEVAAVGRRGAAAVVVTVTEIDDDDNLVLVVRVKVEVEDGVVRRVVELLGVVDDGDVVVVVGRLLVVVVDARTVGAGVTTSVSTITPAPRISFHLVLNFRCKLLENLQPSS